MSKFRPQILLLLFILQFTFLEAQEENGIMILGLSVQGNQTISEASVKVQSGLVEGRQINQEDIAQAIQRLWKLNLFSDINIKLDRETEEGLFLIIQVTEYPRLEKFEVKGNKKIKKSKIDEELNLITGKVLTSNLITEVKRNVQNLYTKEGYLLAEIEPEISDGSKENSKNLTLHVKEGKRVRIKEIDFTGNENFSDRRLRRALKDTHQRNLFILRIGEYEESKYSEDKENLRTFYRNEGYRDFKIISDSIAYSPGNKRMQITINIYEGPRYKYRNIDFTGNTIFTSEQLHQLLNIKPGDYYNDELLQKAIYDRINGAYMDRGYLFFQIMPIEVPVSENEIDITFDITENSIVSINQVNINGNTRTNENVIRRELRMYPGDIFSRDALMRSQNEVYMLNYFANVVPDVVPVSDDAVDVELTVEEKSADQANLSFSISQVYGLVGGGGFQFNNFRGRGQQLAISYQQGTTYSVYRTSATPYKSISVSFSDPWIFDTPNLVGASVTYTERGSSTSSYYYPYDLTLYGGALRWGRRLRWPDNYFRVSWSYGAYKKKYSNIDQEYLSDVLEGKDHTTSIGLTQVITRDSRDRPEFPTIGSTFSWMSNLTGGFLGGTEHYTKNTFSLDYYLPTIWKLVMYNHVEFGMIKKLKSSSIIPPDERFIMGGSGMIYGTALRGYDDNEVGPKYNYGGYYYPYGGETMLRYTFEYRVPISSNPTIYALLFAEAGNVWKYVRETDPFDLKRSIGVGVRFYMPALGLLGIDFGYGFDDIDPEGTTGYGKPEGWKTHFIFGTAY
ncbi:MAG: outer membrane protein assembly factor BamA [Candidatus Marinimicrobia bacterium]|jgi:outer membrane protein insertion porin family|nr:outer membrane protein assembly factor BamA [Candidatus Neomarinimicrobiota bacterium]MCK9559865.1 outer membrane protein assembly factor BamA [Candidatus Neomarinimicrobiota bacterium]MDD5060951.1 outer membrane protein assembly factor BamA [Candidatus Neomarinimicrobiota bacterium]